LILFSNKRRPFHFGSFPLERLPRDPALADAERSRSVVRRRPVQGRDSGALAAAIECYHVIFDRLRECDPALEKAPVPDDLDRRSMDIKGAAYFLDASQVGICALDKNCWYEGEPELPHHRAVVILVEHPRVPDRDSPARAWAAGCVRQAAEFRAYEIAVSVAQHIQIMGFAARAHDRRSGTVDADRLAVLAGLAVRQQDDIVNPFVEREFSLAVVTTEYGLSCDTPLARSAVRGRGLGWWLGIGGAESGIERARQRRRPSHASRYAMESITRVEEPTTLILADEVPRVPQRASFFERAIHGDLGSKARYERTRFAFKHPLAMAMLLQIQAMVEHQDGPVSSTQSADCGNAAANSRAIKSLSYFLGAELTGICKIPDYAWYSHRANGSPIEPGHRYAIVMLIDQGYETMEGASGDDFISGAQSMRAYMRGGVIAGILADHIRGLGFAARAQTNADSEVLHIPLILQAGLGELSRIGELVLNPFVGPRFKSVVITTDLPVEVDKPIDFGLQSFCGHCRKCARECPCDAISWGDKVMFNGYEMWKPDVERCARYRITNQRGLACGRCMKTCPLNKVVDWDGPLATTVASWLGIHARWLKPLLVPLATWLDDRLGYGVRNPVKKWWLDLEIVNGRCVLPGRGVNERDLDLRHSVDPRKQKIAYYSASMTPSPEAQGKPVSPDRKAALAMAASLESPKDAQRRTLAQRPAPAHYDVVFIPADDDRDVS
jgi:reductive dehalogenase